MSQFLVWMTALGLSTFWPTRTCLPHVSISQFVVRMTMSQFVYTECPYHNFSSDWPSQACQPSHSLHVSIFRKKMSIWHGTHVSAEWPCPGSKAVVRLIDVLRPIDAIGVILSQQNQWMDTLIDSINSYGRGCFGRYGRLFEKWGFCSLAYKVTPPFFEREPLGIHHAPYTRDFTYLNQRGIIY